MILRIRNWEGVFENAASKKLVRLAWVAIPNKTDGEGYTALVDHPNAAAHLGAWYAIVEAASKQSPRGNLPGGIPQDIGGICRSLGRMSRLPGGIFQEVIPRLIEIGWLEWIQQDGETLADSPKTLADSPNAAAESAERIEQNGIELKGTTAAAVGPQLLPVELRPQTEYPETLRVLQEHDRSADARFCQRLADTAAREIIGDPVASKWTLEKQRKAVSDPVMARVCREVYATPRKKPPGTGLLLTTVPRILIGGKLNYV